ncbi:MAG: hypothetical protein ACT4O2_10665, partial [Beijerinckiaceae bacterium]
GTAEPTFVYGHGQQGQNTPVRGRSFALDMTYAANENGANTYLGFDFGTSTSSVCYVQAEDVRVVAQRSSDRTWLNLNTLVEILPYVAAYPLARFMSATGRDASERWGREAFEAILMLISYMCYQEHCTLNDGESSHFKEMKRSAGPLWGLFKKCADATGKSWTFTKEALALREGILFAEIEGTVSKIAMPKHGKLAVGLDYPRVLEQLGNTLNKVMAGKVLGYFEDIRPMSFRTDRYTGSFRNARGSAPPFIDRYRYEGKQTYPPEFVFAFDGETQRGLSLYPLILRGLEKTLTAYHDPDFFIFDIARGRKIEFRAVREREGVSIDPQGEYAVVYNDVASRLDSDQHQSWIKGVELRPREID